MAERDTELHNELERLADIARATHDQDWTGPVKEHYSPAELAANAAIADRLVQAGHRPDVAREIVVQWILLGRRQSVLDCVEFFRTEIAPILRPPLPPEEDPR